MRSLTLIIAVAGAYTLLRGWEGSPSLLLRACLAVAILVAGLAFWGIHKNSSQPRMFSLQSATWLDYLSLGVVIIFIEACFVVLTSTLAAPTQETVIKLSELMSDPGKVGGQENGTGKGDGEVQFDGKQSGNWKFNRRLERDLSSNSNYRPSKKAEVFVELESETDATTLFNSRIHLRAFAFSRFDGVSWSAVKTSKQPFRAPITFSPSSKLAHQPGIRHRIYHAISPTGQNLFTSLHGSRKTNLTELTQLAESIYLLPEARNPQAGYNYTVTSHPVHFTDLIGEPITAAAGEPEELDLPPELADQLKQTATSFIYQPSLATRLVELRHFLQDNYTYSLETTNTSGGNPLDNFLYQEKRGYCEHFATAAAMLCRTLGVPSRIAYGWSGGRLYKSQNLFVFRAKDAHAWTEIKLDGYGWVVFDTTPADNAATPEAHAAPEGEIAPDPAETIAEQQLALQHVDPTPLGLNMSPWVLSISLGVLGLCSTAFLVTRSLRRPVTAPDGRPLRCPPPSYLLHFKQACASLGHPMPTGRTLQQHIDQLEESEAAPHFSQELLAYHYGIIYSDEHKNASIEKHLNQHIKRWKRSARTADI